MFLSATILIFPGSSWRDANVVFEYKVQLCSKAEVLQFYKHIA